LLKIPDDLEQVRVELTCYESVFVHKTRHWPASLRVARMLHTTQLV
jgi:hypothetical protein